jgi:hypothetical protein
MQTKRDREQSSETGTHEHQTRDLSTSATRSGADLLRGALRYDEESGNWYLGDVNMTPYLARYRDHEVMVVIAPLGKVEPRETPRLVCDICGCALDDMGDCPRCQLHFVQTARQLRERVQREVLFAEIDQIVEERWRD